MKPVNNHNNQYLTPKVGFPYTLVVVVVDVLDVLLVDVLEDVLLAFGERPSWENVWENGNRVHFFAG